MLVKKKNQKKHKFVIIGVHRFNCMFCNWSGLDNWCLKRHLNTHTKPYECKLCEYRAARAERLSTHVLKVHNKRQCSKCAFLAEDSNQLQMHQLHSHRNNANTPSTVSTGPLLNNRHQQTLQ
jgi:transcription elongation factor Elf1